MTNLCCVLGPMTVHRDDSWYYGSSWYRELKTKYYDFLYVKTSILLTVVIAWYLDRDMARI
jgi:hypothetical protein